MRTVFRGRALWGALLAVSPVLHSEDGSPVVSTLVTPPASVRFAAPETTEVPDFQRHVVPLFGRMGCNGRACHGSFQGRGGFRLSLFGYDFALDHGSLASGDEPRVDLASPEESLVLKKPTRQVPHKGGRRFHAGSWPHHLLRRWIEAGARGLETSPSDGRDGKAADGRRNLVRLEVEPAEIVFGAPDASGQQRASLRVIARWEDGVAEDVTCLSRFRSNDDSVATVDADGDVVAAGRGGTHVVVFYDNGIVAVPVIVPLSDQVGQAYPPVATPTVVDEIVVRQLRKLGVVPSKAASDAEFLRRVSIDMTGTLPTPGEVERFLSDSATDRRERKIDELLERPAYAAWWANKLCDFTGNSPDRQAGVGQTMALKWYEWMYRRVVRNTPYDEVVAGIVLATGRAPGQSYEEYASEMSSYFRETDPADFASRETMPFFWTRRDLKKPEDKALAFAHSFLGVSLDCARCHKHPYDRWTQSDFGQLSSFFSDVKYGVAPESRTSYQAIALAAGLKPKGMQAMRMNMESAALVKGGSTFPWAELYVDTSSGGSGGSTTSSSSVEVEILGHKQSAAAHVVDRRKTLMSWLRRPDNPYFARVFVNRVWAGYFHRGIVDPPDDLNLANPPANRELLDHLTRGFIESGYDMKWVHREIARSATYQRSWRPNATNGLDRSHFSRAIPRRLPAEVIYDALTQVTASESTQEAVRADLSRRAIAHLSTHMAGTYAMHVFGKPERRLNSDCERTSEPSLLQAVFLQNDPLVMIRLRQSGWLAEVEERLAALGDGDARESIDRVAREAYLRTLGRPPTVAEKTRARRYLEEDVESPAEGARDLLWALINTREFILNH